MDKFVIVNTRDHKTKKFERKALINLSNIDVITEEAGSDREDVNGDVRFNMVSFCSGTDVCIKESIDEICKNAFSFEEEEIFS